MKLLRSTRLSVYLICILLAVFVLGQVVPQKQLFTAAEGMAWERENPRLFFVLNTLGLLEIYRSPLTIGLLAIFILNLVFVLESRFDLMVRRCRRPEPGPVEGSGVVELDMGGKGEEEVLERLKRMLPHSRLLREGGTFVVYKDRFGPVGFFLFHASFIVLFLAGLTIFYTRSVGTAAVTEGQTFSGAAGEYKTLRRPIVGELPAVRFMVRDIKPTYEKGQPTDLEVRIAAFEDHPQPREKTIRVNQPYTRGDSSVLITNIDVSPLIKLQSQDGELLYEYAFVSLNVLGGEMDSYVFPFSIYRVDFQFYPDFAIDRGLEYSKSPELKNPKFHIYFYESGKQVLDRVMGPGQAVRVGDLWFAIEDLRYWGEFKVVRERGKVLLWAGFIMGITGLVWRFFFYRSDVRGEFRDGKLRLSMWSEMPAKMSGRRLDGIVRELEGFVRG
jgi:hypothetical protein